MACGVWNPYQRILDVSTITRTLNNGDSIYLTITNLAAIDSNEVTISGVITYSIKYNCIERVLTPQ